MDDLHRRYGDELKSEDIICSYEYRVEDTKKFTITITSQKWRGLHFLCAITRFMTLERTFMKAIWRMNNELCPLHSVGRIFEQFFHIQKFLLIVEIIVRPFSATM